MSAAGGALHWIGEGLFGAATAAIAEGRGFDLRGEADEGRFAVAVDFLDYRALKRLETKFAKAEASWTFVAPFRNFILCAPVFGPRSRRCVTCFERRLLSLPLPGSESELEHQLLRQMTLHRRSLHPAFTPATAKLAVAITLERLRADVPAGTCLLLDQLAFSHSSAEISALHGCPQCRPAQGDPSERFSAPLKELLTGGSR